MNAYRQRILASMTQMLGDKRPIRTGLDFGAGDGWFSQQLESLNLVGSVTPIDVKRREGSLVNIQLYDGLKLPFANDAFDIAYSIDVLHHCPDPEVSLRDLMRCTRRFLLIKDHTWSNQAGRLGLAILDEIGNRKFGIPSLYKYQKRWDWLPIIEQSGFRQVQLIYPAECHVGILGRLTNNLQFVGLWERC